MLDEYRKLDKEIRKTLGLEYYHIFFVDKTNQEFDFCKKGSMVYFFFRHEIDTDNEVRSSKRKFGNSTRKIVEFEGRILLIDTHGGNTPYIRIIMLNKDNYSNLVDDYLRENEGSSLVSSLEGAIRLNVEKLTFGR